MITKEILPQLIKNYCQEAGISYAELARQLNIRRQSLNNWIQGKSFPSFENYIKLMEVISNEENY